MRLFEIKHGVALRILASVNLFMCLMSVSHAQVKLSSGFYSPSPVAINSNTNWLWTPPAYPYDGKYHLGSDYGSAYGETKGKPVYAVAHGWIGDVYAGSDADHVWFWVQCEAQEGSFYALYGHIYLDSRFKKGSEVQAGDQIGTVYDQGSNSHLHFGVRPEGELNSGWGRGDIPAKWNGDVNNLDWKGFVPAFDFLMSHHPKDSVIAASPRWTSLPPTSDNPRRYYRSNERLSYTVDGSRPNTVQEFINGNVTGQYDTGGGYIDLAYGPQGWNKYEVAAKNATGVWSYTGAFYVGYDTTPPTVTLTGGAAPGVWLRGRQSVTYTGSDVGAGFKDSQWWLDGVDSGGWTGENPRTITMPASEGKYKLYAEVADDAWTGAAHFGNSSGNVLLGEFWFDNTPPNAHFVSITPGSGGDPTQVSIVVDGDDPGYPNTGSGIASGTVTVDGTSTTESNGAHVWDASLAIDGPHTIRAVVTDGAGNATTITSTYTIDRTPPAVTLSLSPGTPNGMHGYYTTQPTATLTPSKASGATLHYRVSGGGDQTYAGPFGVTARGKVAIDVWAVSASGRVGPTQTTSLLIDTTPPAGFTLEGEGDQTPSTSSINLSLRGTIDAESPLWGITYRVGKSAGDDAYRKSTAVTAMGPWLAVDGLSLPVGAKAYITLTLTNYAGLTSAAYSTTGITVNPAAWNHAIWNDVVGGAGDRSTDGGTLLLGGTLGEALVGRSLTDNGDGLLDAGLWSLMLTPVVSADVTLGDLRASAVAGTKVQIDLRLPGTTTVVESHLVALDANGHLTFASAHTGTYDVAIKGSHWLRKVVRNVAVTATGAAIGAVSLVNGDVNGDNRVTLVDYTLLKNAFGSAPGQPAWNALADLNGDGHVTLLDYSILQKNFQKQGDP